MATLTCPLYTTFGAHRQAVDLLALARSLGLDADLESTGGLFAKSHVIRARGSEKAVQQFAAALAGVRGHDIFDPAFPCRVMPTRHCPDSYGDVCGDRPCARYESEDETPWLPEAGAKS